MVGDIHEMLYIIGVCTIFGTTSAQGKLGTSRLKVLKKVNHYMSGGGTITFSVSGNGQLEDGCVLV